MHTSRSQHIPCKIQSVMIVDSFTVSVIVFAVVRVVVVGALTVVFVVVKIVVQCGVLWSGVECSGHQHVSSSVDHRLAG